MALFRLALFLLTSVIAYNRTDQSSVCKKCIDQNFIYCPNSDLQSGFCCSQSEKNSCPKAGACSSDFEIPQIKYQLCPSEVKDCLYPRTIVPTNSSTIFYQYTGQFKDGDLCTYRIQAPSYADPNDQISFTLEFILNSRVTILKGKSLVQLTGLYNATVGQTYTATRFNNLYVQFTATSNQSGMFTFNVGYKPLNGFGIREPDVVTVVNQTKPVFVN